MAKADTRMAAVNNVVFMTILLFLSDLVKPEREGYRELQTAGQ